MKQTFTALIALLFIGQLAYAIDMPSRKAGLWEIKTSDETNPAASQTMQQCIDATTDKKMQEMGKSMTAALGSGCTEDQLKKEGDKYISSVVCSFAGTKVSTRSVTSGDFAKSYKVETNTKYDPPMMGMSGGKSTMEATYKGACSEGMKPGDMLTADGQKFNIEEMVKSLPAMGNVANP